MSIGIKIFEDNKLFALCDKINNFIWNMDGNYYVNVKDYNTNGTTYSAMLLFQKYEITDKSSCRKTYVKGFEESEISVFEDRVSDFMKTIILSNMSGKKIFLDDDWMMYRLSKNGYSMMVQLDYEDEHEDNNDTDELSKSQESLENEFKKLEETKKNYESNHAQNMKILEEELRKLKNTLHDSDISEDEVTEVINKERDPEYSHKKNMEALKKISDELDSLLSDDEIDPHDEKETLNQISDDIDSLHDDKSDSYDEFDVEDYKSFSEELHELLHELLEKEE